jgi:hypothetical protein
MLRVVATFVRKIRHAEGTSKPISRRTPSASIRPLSLAVADGLADRKSLSGPPGRWPDEQTHFLPWEFA